MLYINPESINIKRASIEFLSKLKPRVEKAIKKYKDDEFYPFLETNVVTRLDEILTGKPNVIYPINEDLRGEINENEELRNAVKSIFNYKYFAKKNENAYCAYDLASSLGIRTCVYCNRNYAITIKKKKKTIRPDFDHFLDKAKNPLLGLSFFNLIPSCGTCNRVVKHTKQFGLATHLHPYVDNTSSDFSFTYRYSTVSKDGLEIIFEPLEPSGRLGKSLEDLKIKQLYNGHTQELYDLLKLKQSFSDTYLSFLGENLMEGITLSETEIYRLAFGTYMEEHEFSERPFSKFKRDILKEIGVLKNEY